VRVAATNSQGASAWGNNLNSNCVITNTVAPIVQRPTTQLDSTRGCVNVNWGQNAFGNSNVGSETTYEL
jgi:hypothetical protein